MSWLRSTGVGNELQQRSVGIAKVDTSPRPFGAETLDRPTMDRHVAVAEMRDGLCDGAFPFKTQVAVAGLDRQPRHLGGCEAWAMQVELSIAEPVAPSRRPSHQLGSQHVAIEGVRALPVGHVDDAMVELDWQCHERSRSCERLAV